MPSDESVCCNRHQCHCIGLARQKSAIGNGKVLEAFWQGKIVPLVNDEIIDEYDEVLRRPKFRFPEELVAAVVEGIKQGAVSAERVKTRQAFPDPKDAVFYEVALSKDDAYLITGNIKHFPHTPIVVTPAEMLDILSSWED